MQCDEQDYADAMEQPTCSAGLRAEQNHPRLAAHTVVLLFLDAMLRSKDELNILLQTNIDPPSKGG